MYGLYAVVVHNGSTLKSGHYVAYVRRRPNKQQTSTTSLDGSSWEYDQRVANDGTWYYANDRTITKCSRGFGDVRKNKVYLLFYELLPRLQN